MGTRSFGCPAAGLSLCLIRPVCQRGSVSRQNQEKSRCERPWQRSLLLIPELDTQMLPNALLSARIRHHTAIHDFTELEHGIAIRYCQRELHMLLDQ